VDLQVVILYILLFSVEDDGRKDWEADNNPCMHQQF